MAPRLIAAIRHSAVIAALLSFLWPGLGQGWVRLAAPGANVRSADGALLGAGVVVMIVQGKARSLGLLLSRVRLIAGSAFLLVALPTPAPSSSPTPAPGSGSIC